MNKINIILVTFTIGLLAIACNQVTEKVKEETQK
jgi:hypothetical protein